jgi:hypothetical protein
VGERSPVTEATIDPVQGFPSINGNEKNVAYNPFDERHQQTILCKVEVALRDIDVGEEVLVNYLMYGDDDWEMNLKEIKEMCSGHGGRVSAYEEKSSCSTCSDNIQKIKSQNIVH